MNTKIKVGFGPHTTANSFRQSGEKVVAALNKYNDVDAVTFSAPFNFDNLNKYDVLVFIKIAPDFKILQKLKKSGKKLIFDYQDTFLFPSIYELNPVRRVLKKVIYLFKEYSEKRRYRLFDRYIICSPAMIHPLKREGMNPIYIPRQIYNEKKECCCQYSQKKENLTVLWTGVSLNISANKPVESVLFQLYKKYNLKIIYLTDIDQPADSFIEYRRWSIDTWEDELNRADIAFRWWNKNDFNQYWKDPNKILAYMAAGLPLICKPTLSERDVISDGVNGLFAETPEEFGLLLEKLTLNPSLRADIGKKAYEHVWKHYSLDVHVEKIHDIINSKI